MPLNNLAGRIPRISSPMSPRVIYIGAGLAVIGILAIAYGFNYRIQRKHQMKSLAATQIAAGDAATSNRIAVHGLPGTEPHPVQPPPGVLPATPNLPNTGPVVQAAAQPAGPVQPQYTRVPEVDPALRLKAEREQKAYERRMAAIDAPTGESQSSSNAPVLAPRPADQLQAELARLAGNNAQPSQTQLLAERDRVAGLGDDDLNGQEAKRAFQKTVEGDYLKTTRVAPISPWVVERGEVIPAGLPNQIVSDLPGDLVAEVKRDIYDTPQHKFVMIPAGSLLAGEYNSAVSYGQKRVQVIWNYLRFPDGSYVDLDKFVGHSADGATGLGDQVDNHLKRLIGGIAMSSLFAAGIQISQNHTNAGGSTLAYPSNTQIAASAAGQQAAEVGQQITSQNLRVQPTIKIRPGDVFSVSVMKSIVFPGPYKAIAMGGRQ